MKTVAWQSIIRKDGEVAAADVEVGPEGKRQKQQRFSQGLLFPAGFHTGAQG